MLENGLKQMDFGNEKVLINKKYIFLYIYIYNIYKCNYITYFLFL